MLKLLVNAKEIPITISKFPAGETMISIRNPRHFDVGSTVNGMITMQFESNEDLINLALLKDCVERTYLGQVKLALTMDYVPYARQDRVCNTGESLSIKVIAGIINAMEFEHVFTKDNHSDVSTALINNCINLGISNVARNLVNVLPNGLDTILVSPDAGANKKVYGFAKDLGFKHVVRADKTRDVATGKITGTKVFWDVLEPMELSKPSYDICIVDDILDNGGTFIPLAEELRKLTSGKIYLYITHGMFNSGIDKFNGVFDKIFVSNVMIKQKYMDTYGIMEKV